MVTEPHLEKLTDGLNDGIYKIDNNSFKPYACCKHSHAALYAMQVLRTEHGLKPDDVEAIEILVNEITDFLINNPQPEIRMAASSVSNIVLPGCSSTAIWVLIAS